MRRLAIFAHYDGQAEVKRYVLAHLAELARVCERIVFVSTSPLPEAETKKLAPYCQEVHLRDNVGLDFGMWRHAIESVDFAAEGVDELVLVNSSVFGPLRPLQSVFDQMESRGLDVWGVSDNVDIEWHVQSYFMVFRACALHAPAFKTFWASVLPYRSKTQLIRSYEVGLSVFFSESGFRVGALVPMALLPKKGWRTRLLHDEWPLTNPTCYYPLELHELGSPYFKVELLRDNPARIELEAVRTTMARAGYDLSLIEFDRPPTGSRPTPPGPRT